VSDWWWYVDDPLNQLSQFQIRHGFVATFELVTAQTFAVFQEWNLMH